MISDNQLATSQRPDKRFILLGASNLTLGLPLIVRSLRTAFPEERIEILAAHGHGRSFLNWSQVLIRGLPSLEGCDLWNDLDQLPPAEQTFGLVTDLGCDLMYGARPQPIIDAVSRCLHRLKLLNARTVFVRPPIDRCQRMSAWQYQVAKNAFFPGPTPPWSQMLADIKEVDQQVLRFVNQLKMAAVAPPAQWYGVDPIHVRRSMRQTAWNTIMNSWNAAESLCSKRANWKEHLSIWCQRPSERKLFGRRRQHPQPACQWKESASLWLY